MSVVSFTYGPLQPDPPKFKPTFSYTDHKYLYKLDFEAGLCKRVPLHWDAGESAGYYQILKAGRKRKLHWPRPEFRLPLGLALSGLLLIAGIYLLFYPLYPALQYQLRQTAWASSNTRASVALLPITGVNQLVIPKIDVKADILESPTLDILNQKEGVWHQTGQLDKGNLVLAGHRFKYLPPNTTTFYNLDKLAAGDLIRLEWQRKSYLYVVKETFVVPADRVDILKPTKEPTLTLYTCNEKSQTHRVVVRAEPQP